MTDLAVLKEKLKEMQVRNHKRRESVIVYVDPYVPPGQDYMLPRANPNPEEKTLAKVQANKSMSSDDSMLNSDTSLIGTGGVITFGMNDLYYNDSH